MDKKEKKKQTTLTLSFPDDELWVYEEICKHSAKGGWVKDILKEYIRNQNKSQREIYKESTQREIYHDKPSTNGLLDI